MIELKFLLYQDFKRVKLQHMFFHSGVNEKKWLNKNLQKIMKMTMMNMVHCLLLLSAWESEAWETFVQIFLSHKPIQCYTLYCSICICIITRVCACICIRINIGPFNISILQKTYSKLHTRYCIIYFYIYLNFCKYL